MTYDIFSSTAPAMPATGNGTKFIDFILSNASKDMKEALVPRLEPSLSPTFARVELRGNAEKIEGLPRKQYGAEYTILSIEAQRLVR